jgi:hypothetical protein
MGQFSTILCGVILLAGTGIASANPVNVAIVSTVGNAQGFESDVISKIQANTPFLTISVLDAINTTPSVSTLEGYAAIMVVVGNTAFKDGVTLGTNIDTYLREGHGVIIAAKSNTFTNCGAPGLMQLCGNFAANDDWAIEPGTQVSGVHGTLLPTFTASDPVFAGVTSFDGGSFSDHVNGIVNGSATKIGTWSDGTPFAATRNVGTGLEIALNFFPVSDSPSIANGLYWLHGTDGGLIMANAFNEAAGITGGSAADVPEPANYFVMCSGLGLVGLLLRRRRNDTMR